MGESDRYPELGDGCARAMGYVLLLNVAVGLFVAGVWRLVT